MPRYRRRYRNSLDYDYGAERARQHIREAHELYGKYQDLYLTVKTAFFVMPAERRDALLREYGSRYGRSAQKYAIESMSSWRSGAIQISGQTMRRLLDLVPRHVSMEKKYEFVKQTRARTLQLLKPNSIKIQLTGSDTFAVVLGQCLNAIAAQDQITFPEEFFEVREWITAQDAKLMERLIVDIEKEAHEERIIKTLITIPYVLALRDALPKGMRLSMTVKVPTVTYEITYTKTKLEAQMMEDREDDLLKSIQRAESDMQHHKGEITFHEHLLRNLDQYLTKEQQAELYKIAAREGVELDALRQKMLIQSQAANYNLKQFQEIIEGLKGTGSRATGTFTTASGEIKIESASRRGCVGTFFFLAVLISGIAILVFTI